MPADLVSRLNLDLLFPPFLEKVLGVLASCRAQSQDYWATFGFRSFAEQAQMYGAYLAGKGGRAAPAGASAHNFGLAVDLCPDGSPAPGLQPNWTAGAYTTLGAEVAKAGLVWGRSFGDMPHVQWPGFVSGNDLRPLKDLWLSAPGTDLARLQRVWEYVRNHP